MSSAMLGQAFALPPAGPLASSQTIIGSQTPEDFICNPIRLPGAFSKAECEAIVALGEAGAAVNAGLSRPMEGYRSGLARLIASDAASRWLYERVGEMLVAVNDWYRFEIAGFVEPLLYCAYPERGQFDWHVDSGEGRTSTRKITLSVQLSDADEYDGGALEFVGQGELPGARRVGTAIAFPAFLHHRVTGVQRGMRRALVAWAHGPAFR